MPHGSFVLDEIASSLVALEGSGAQAELQGLEALADLLPRQAAFSYPKAKTTESLILYFSMCHPAQNSYSLHSDECL